MSVLVQQMFSGWYLPAIHHQQSGPGVNTEKHSTYCSAHVTGGDLSGSKLTPTNGLIAGMFLHYLSVSREHDRVTGSQTVRCFCSLLSSVSVC